HANLVEPVMPRRVLKSASVKKNRPAYITATKRLLFDIDDSASMVVDASKTSTAEYSVIAGIRYMLLRMKVRSPANTAWVTSSIIAGRKVTDTRNRTRIASLPAMYSALVIGLDKYNCRALARRSLAIKPA